MRFFRKRPLLLVKRFLLVNGYVLENSSDIVPREVVKIIHQYYSDKRPLLSYGYEVPMRVVFYENIIYVSYDNNKNIFEKNKFSLDLLELIAKHNSFPTHITVGEDYFFVLFGDRSNPGLYAIGNNELGQLGIPGLKSTAKLKEVTRWGSKHEKISLKKLINLNGDVVDLVTGSFSTSLLFSNGVCYSWGVNTYHETNDADNADVSIRCPQKMEFNHGTIKKIIMTRQAKLVYSKNKDSDSFSLYAVGNNFCKSLQINNEENDEEDIDKFKELELEIMLKKNGGVEHISLMGLCMILLFGDNYLHVTGGKYGHPLPCTVSEKAKELIEKHGGIVKIKGSGFKSVFQFRDGSLYLVSIGRNFTKIGFEKFIEIEDYHVGKNHLSVLSKDGQWYECQFYPYHGTNSFVAKLINPLCEDLLDSSAEILKIGG